MVGRFVPKAPIRALSRMNRFTGILRRRIKDNPPYHERTFPDAFLACEHGIKGGQFTNCGEIAHR